MTNAESFRSGVLTRSRKSFKKLQDIFSTSISRLKLELSEKNDLGKAINILKILEDKMTVLSFNLIEDIRDRYIAKIKLLEETLEKSNRFWEKHLAEVMKELSTDSQTNLMAFKAFRDKVKSYLYETKSHRGSAFGMLDVNHFKEINDKYGHYAGNLVLKKLGQLIRENIRSDRRKNHSPDLWARFGGDEFCFFLPDIRNTKMAEVVIERFRTAVNDCNWENVHSGLKDFNMTISVGVVFFRLDDPDREELNRNLAFDWLMIRSDYLLYEYKKVSRVASRPVIFVETMVLKNTGLELVASGNREIQLTFNFEADGQNSEVLGIAKSGSLAPSPIKGLYMTQYAAMF